MERVCVQFAEMPRAVTPKSERLLKTGQTTKGRRVRAYAGSGSGFAVPFRAQAS